MVVSSFCPARRCEPGPPWTPLNARGQGVPSTARVASTSYATGSGIVGYALATRGYEATQPAITWQISKADEVTTVVLNGEIDESAPFTRLRAELSGQVVIDLQDVRRINSAGVREWVNLVGDLESCGVTKLTFVRCSPGIVTQLNMIYNFCGPGVVESFIAPFMCDGCGTEEFKILEASAFPDGPASPLPAFSCPSCGQDMEFDELPDYYLSFLGKS